MKQRIGIRREDKNKWERRVPLTPRHVAELVKKGFEVVVQPSPIRAFSEDEYKKAGAQVQEDLSNCQLVFAVKEIPQELFRPKHTYVFFAHVIKGQSHNMPMLRTLLDQGATLIDYEKVTDDQGKRLIFFGRHAGQAGMIDSLWALGRRLEAEGFQTPLARIQQAHKYGSLKDAQAAIAEVGREIAKVGLPKELCPLVVGFAGYGNVSQGAQQVFDVLPFLEVAPEKLKSTAESKRPQRKKLVKVVFKEEHMVKPKAPGQAFVLNEYFSTPEKFDPDFERHLPHLTVMINCIYWAPKYPRLVTRQWLKKAFVPGALPRLRVIGDISCDIEGSVECTLECTESGNPVYVYLPAEDRIEYGVTGRGPVVLAVDNLPCELPVEASKDFGNALMPYVEALARTDFAKPFEALGLPKPIQRAVIAHGGKLTPGFGYLEKNLRQSNGGPK